jgi:hypothetical protein
MKFNYAFIIERNCRGSRKNESDMFKGTTRRANARTNVLAPFPTGLICRATDCHATDTHQLEFAFLHRAHFIRRVE